MNITPSEYSKLLKIIEEENIDLDGVRLVKDFPLKYRGKVVARVGTLPKYKLAHIVMLVRE